MTHSPNGAKGHQASRRGGTHSAGLESLLAWLDAEVTGEEFGVVEIVGEGPAPVGGPVGGAGIPRFGQRDDVVDLEVGRVGGPHGVVAADPVAGHHPAAVGADLGRVDDWAMRISSRRGWNPTGTASHGC